MNVLLVDDEPNIVKTIAISLSAMDLQVESFVHPRQALEYARSSPKFDIAFLDLKMYPMDGIELMEELLRIMPKLTVVIITAHGTVDTAVKAIKRGAFDYLQKPFDLEQLRLFINAVVHYHRLKRAANHSEQPAVYSKDIITQDARMVELLTLATRVAATPLTVLIEGESGTGKELFAKLIHERSLRASEPYVKVNCAAIPENLLESELFGHIQGAFTGALKDRVGRFEAASGGTIFLDEVGELPLPLQSKLLRVLQSREYERLGESITRTVDVRVVAATNRDLAQEIQLGNFREDLFYRLNSVRLKIPPLRERKKDIPILVAHFLQKYGSQKSATLTLSSDAMDALMKHEWKGNIRELENAISRAVFLAVGSEIRVDDLPDELRLLAKHSHANEQEHGQTLEDIEKEHIARVLAEAKNYEEAAKILDIDTATLWRKRKKYNL
ncbi:MAG: sigma-54-dependent Fis family transcriptional regulator [Chlorobi bacterium CHB2]|nr:sigma-54-dependent Fis family transcriptional regulator [Chlorobi bacterium CHB2]